LASSVLLGQGTQESKTNLLMKCSQNLSLHKILKQSISSLKFKTFISAVNNMFSKKKLVSKATTQQKEITYE
jgi:hypothetical protein